MSLSMVGSWRGWRELQTEQEVALRICQDVIRVPEHEIPRLALHATAFFSRDVSLSSAVRAVCSDPAKLNLLGASAETTRLAEEVTALEARLTDARRQSASLGRLLELEQERKWVLELAARRDALATERGREDDP